MSWGFYKPYVPRAARLAKASKSAAKLQKIGQKLDPVVIEGRSIAKTFWGKAWCENLEAYSDYENRLPRGRSYARNGSVIDLKIETGSVAALVQGSSLYKVSVTINPLASGRWKTFVDAATGQVTNLLDLLQGRLSKELLEFLTSKQTGLFPSPKEIRLSCSCPDWADMCKHVAAVLYGVGARLDSKPELFFTLRGVDMQDLLAAAGRSAVLPVGAPTEIEDGDLSSIFGVEIETVATVPTAPENTAPIRKKGRSSPSAKTTDKSAGNKKPKAAKKVPVRKAIKKAGKASIQKRNA